MHEMHRVFDLSRVRMDDDAGRAVEIMARVRAVAEILDLGSWISPLGGGCFCSRAIEIEIDLWILYGLEVFSLDPWRRRWKMGGGRCSLEHTTPVRSAPDVFVGKFRGTVKGADGRTDFFVGRFAGVRWCGGTTCCT